MQKNLGLYTEIDKICVNLHRGSFKLENVLAFLVGKIGSISKVLTDVNENFQPFFLNSR